MFCTKCGMENADGSSFCIHCSANLNESAPLSQEGIPVATPPQKKGIKPLYLIIGGAVAVVLVVVLLIVLLSGGSSPESVVEDYVEAYIILDFEVMGECLGYDYKQTAIQNIEDLDECIEDFENGLARNAEDLEDIGIDLLEWEDRLYEIETEEDYVELKMEFQAAYHTLYIEEHEISYEITHIEATELTRRSDIRDAEEEFEDWLDDMYEEDCVFLFEEDDVEAFYTVEFKLRYEEDGDRESEKVTILVVETSEGYFLINPYV